MRAELDLAGRMCRQNFVESEIQILISEFRHQRRQMNNEAVRDARFHRHASQRRNLDLSASQSFDVETQQGLYCVKRQSLPPCMQRVVTASCFDREIASARARIARLCQAAARPFFKLLN